MGNVLTKKRYVVRHPNGEWLDDTISPTENITIVKAVRPQSEWDNYMKTWEEEYYPSGYRVIPVDVIIVRRSIDG